MSEDKPLDQTNSNQSGNVQPPPAPSPIPVDKIYPTAGQPIITSAPEPKHHKSKLIVGIFIIIIVVASIAILWSNGSLGNLSKNDKAAPTNSTKLSSDNPQPKVTIAYPNSYKVFKTSPVSNEKAVTYTLTDDKGAKVSTAVGNNSLSLVTTVGTDALLFVDLSGSSGTPYYLFSKDGLQLLNAAPKSMQNQSLVNSDNPRGLTGYGQRSVIYQYCSDIDENSQPINCDLRITDLTTGKETIKNNDELKTYSAQLMAISPDKKTAYFMGISKEDAKAFTDSATKITGGASLSENDPKAAQVYKLKVKRTVLAVDIASQKLTSKKVVEVQYTHYAKLWFSPNGQNIVYSNGGEKGVLQYVRVSDGKESAISLPDPGQATEPWAGTTSTHDPIFSPDGAYMAYATYGPGSSTESIGVIDFSNLKAKQVASGSRPTQIGSLATNYYDNLHWLDSSHFYFTGNKENSQYSLTNSDITKLDSTYGSLIGIADGLK